MILDVGCGDNPRGDINLDLYTGKTPHRPYAPKIEPKSIPNFVKGDARFLPFRANSFDLVRSAHLLEHMLYPSVALNEMLRCSKSRVIVDVPHRFLDRCGNIEVHAQKFNIKNLTKFLKKFPIHFEISLSYKCFPHQYVPLIRLPSMIRIEVVKKEPYL